eukprot:GEMP01058941.1.p1 GENE.GEMP01058941.1~~GEMP01058941.1.p1  ORF type:complete len:273 (+),score=53.69 GEMP01058941.1:150-968(+)
MRVFMTLLALGRHMSTPWEGQAFRDLVQDVNAFDSDDVDATRDQSAADELLDAVPTQRRDFLRTSTRNSDVATPSMIDPSMGSATSADPPEVATQLNMANPADEPPVPTVVPPAVMEQPPVASAESPVEPLARLADSRVGSWRTNPHHLVFRWKLRGWVYSIVGRRNNSMKSTWHFKVRPTSIASRHSAAFFPRHRGRWTPSPWVVMCAHRVRFASQRRIALRTDLSTESALPAMRGDKRMNDIQSALIRLLAVIIETTTNGYKSLRNCDLQ